MNLYGASVDALGDFLPKFGIYGDFVSDINDLAAVEAQRIQIETQAAAEAEKTRLQGEGQANYRREIANGIVDQIKSLQAVGMNVNDVNNVVLFNQYLDTMRTLASSQNAKTVVLPASTPGGFNEMRDQIIQAMMSADEAAK